MIRLPARFLVATVLLAAPVGAQQQPGTFTLPEPTPTPTPAPAGPADERGGVRIPPRTVPAPASTPSRAPTTTAVPVIQPLPQTRPTPAPAATPRTAPATPARQDAPASSSEAAPTTAAAATPTPAAPAAAGDPLTAAPTPGFTLPESPAAPDAAVEPLTGPSVLPEWWPLAAGGLGALALVGGGLVWRRKRRPAVPRLAPPPATGTASDPAAADQPRLDLTLEIIGATRSVMMFTLQYRLTIANRSPRAVNDLALALQLACARASAANAPSAGAAQGLERIARIGPHQSRSVTGTVQLPLSAISPVRQGSTPMFVPLAHATLEGEGLRAISRSFVIGPRSPSGRIHPIPLDQPPGGIAGLVAQAIVIPPATAAA